MVVTWVPQPTGEGLHYVRNRGLAGSVSPLVSIWIEVRGDESANCHSRNLGCWSPDQQEFWEIGSEKWEEVYGEMEFFRVPVVGELEALMFLAKAANEFLARWKHTETFATDWVRANSRDLALNLFLSSLLTFEKTMAERQRPSFLSTQVTDPNPAGGDFELHDSDR